VSFDPRQSMKIDADGKRLLIRCPFWANDVLNSVPSKKWDKRQKAWAVHIIKQNVESVKNIIRMGGVETTDAAKRALAEYEESIKRMGVRGVGFPVWYKHKVPPLPHQVPGLDKGYGLTAYALFMPMQTGKSKVVIDLTAAHRMEGHIDSVLILVKRTLRRNWLIQFNTHCPIPWSAHLPETGEAGTRRFMHWLTMPHDFKIMLVGWESLSAGGMVDICNKFMDTMIRPAVIGDELTYIAGHKADRSERAVALARKAVYKYGLSGSPALEGPLNLFMEFEFLDPNIIGIGDYYAFRNRYAIMGGYMRETPNGSKVPTQIVGYQNMEELTGMISPYIYQVDKKVLKLPPKRFERRTVELTPEQRKVYDRIKKDGVLALDGHPERALQNVLEVYLRLQQVAGGYGVSGTQKRWMGRDGKPRVKMIYDPVELIPPERNPKIIEIESIFEEINKTKQSLVWAVFQPEIEALTKRLRAMGLRVGELHGKIQDEARQPMVDEFQRGGIDVIVGNAGTGGMGFTMHAAEVSIFYNNSFKAIDRVQAEDRPDSIGQTKSGIWIDIAAEKTVDLTVLAALEQKMDLSEFLHHRIDQAIKLMDGDV
jgi:hypothetical protein